MKQTKIYDNKNLQLQTKILIITITTGFLLVCITSFLALSALKHDYESNFPGPINEIQKLKKIQDFYIIDINNYVNQKTDISSNRDQMIKIWKEYKRTKQENKNAFAYLKSLYQKIFSKETYEQLLLYKQQTNQEINDANKIIRNTNELLNKLYAKQSSQYREDLKTLLSQSIVINESISDIITLQLKMAMLKNATTDIIYQMTFIILIIFMFIVVFMTLFLSNLVLKYIKNINQELHDRVETKTIELQEINKNLQQTIEHEIEESRKKDQIMYQQARLASMGDMIQNIAHQWRQPLNSLILLIQSFKTKANAGKLDKKFIDTQTEDGLRIARNMSATIENFRNFFRISQLKKQFSISNSIQDCIKIMNPTLKQHNINVHANIKEEVLYYGHENAFAQIILNILKNSYDAILEHRINNGECEISLKKLPECIQIEIKDNAGGIKESIMDKIFEPYFTTKHKSVGTGIGLYMTKEIVEKQMYGIISVSNSNWNSKIFKECCHFGAIFLIQLPIIKSK